MRDWVPTWHRFWFAPVPAFTLAWVRIAFGLVVVAWALSLAPDLATLFGPAGVVEAPAGHSLVYAVLLAGAVGTVVGYRTRLAAAAVFGALVWFDRVNPWALNAGDAVLRHLAFILMLAPSGTALSIDARRSDVRWPTVPSWGLRLIQLQLSLIYLVAVAAKLQGDAWRDGIAASLALGVPDIGRFPLPDLVTSSELAANAVTWGTLALEGALGLLVWNRRLRPWLLGAGACFHLLIDYSLRAGFFSWAMLVCYLAFVPPSAGSRLVALARAPLRRSRGSGSGHDQPR